MAARASVQYDGLWRKGKWGFVPYVGRAAGAIIRWTVSQSATDCLNLRHKVETATKGEWPAKLETGSVLIVALHGRHVRHLAIERGPRDSECTCRSGDIPTILRERCRNRLRSDVL